MKNKMGTFRIVHTCGHRQTHKVYVDKEGNPNKDYIDILRNRLCSYCQKEKERKENPPLSWEEKKKIAYETAIQHTKEYGLPDLTGTPKQIKWAIVLRDEILQSIQKEKEFRKQYKLTPYLAQKWDTAYQWVCSQTDAKFWIDNRGRKPSNFISIGFLELGLSWIDNPDEEDDWDDRYVARLCNEINYKIKEK